MAIGDFDGAVSEEAAIVEVGKLLVAAETAEQVLDIIDQQGPKLGYKVCGYLCRLVKRGKSPEEAASILKAGWSRAKGIPSPFGKTDSDGPKAGKTAPAPVVVVVKSPEESYWDSLTA